MSIPKNKAIVQQVLQTWSAQDFESWAALVAPGYVHHSTQGDLDLQGFMRGATYLSQAFSNWQYTPVHMVAEGDRVAAYLQVRVTHHGEFLGIPATGQTIDLAMTYHCRIVDRKIVEDWDVWPFQTVIFRLGGKVQVG